MVGVGGGHDGGGERSDEGDEPASQQECGGQHVGGPVRGGSDAGEQQEAGRGHQRTDSQLDRRADVLRERARSCREQEHEDGGRKHRHSRLERGPSGRDLEFVGDEEEGEADGGVEEDGADVDHGERAAPEEGWWNKRRRGAAEVKYEHDHGADGDGKRCDNCGIIPAARTDLGQRPRNRGQTDDRIPCAANIEPPGGMCVFGLGHGGAGYGVVDT